MKTIAFGGSRDLSSDWVPTIGRAVNAVRSLGYGISVGCCVGTDEYVLRYAIEQHLANDCWGIDTVTCHTICASDGKGRCTLTADKTVANFCFMAPNNVKWLAGGPLTVPLKARLSSRTRAVIESVDTAVVLFFSSSRSVGTSLAGVSAVQRGLKVIGFGYGSLPSLGSGVWVESGKPGVWGLARVWVPTGLF